MAGRRSDPTRLNNRPQVSLQGQSQRLQSFAAPVNFFNQIDEKKSKLYSLIETAQPVVQQVADKQLTDEKEAFTQAITEQAYTDLPGLLDMEPEELEEHLKGKDPIYSQVVSPMLGKHKANRILADAEDHDEEATGISKQEFMKGQFERYSSVMKDQNFLKEFTGSVVPKLSEKQEQFEDEVLVEKTDKLMQGLFSAVKAAKAAGQSPEEVHAITENFVGMARAQGMPINTINQMLADAAEQDLQEGSTLFYEATRIAGANGVSLYDDRRYNAQLSDAKMRYDKVLADKQAAEAAAVKEAKKLRDMELVQDWIRAGERGELELGRKHLDFIRGSDSFTDDKKLELLRSSKDVIETSGLVRLRIAAVAAGDYLGAQAIDAKYSPRNAKYADTVKQNKLITTESAVARLANDPSGSAPETMEAIRAVELLGGDVGRLKSFFSPQLATTSLGNFKNTVSLINNYVAYTEQKGDFNSLSKVAGMVGSEALVDLALQLKDRPNLDDESVAALMKPLVESTRPGSDGKALPLPGGALSSMLGGDHLKTLGDSGHVIANSWLPGDDAEYTSESYVARSLNAMVDHELRLMASNPSNFDMSPEIARNMAFQRAMDKMWKVDKSDFIDRNITSNKYEPVSGVENFTTGEIISQLGRPPATAQEEFTKYTAPTLAKMVESGELPGVTRDNAENINLGMYKPYGSSDIRLRLFVVDDGTAKSVRNKDGSEFSISLRDFGVELTEYALSNSEFGREADKAYTRGQEMFQLNAL